LSASLAGTARPVRGAERREEKGDHDREDYRGRVRTPVGCRDLAHRVARTVIACGTKFDRSVERQWIGSLARLFVPGNVLRLGQFGSCHREVAFSDPFVVPPHFVIRRELGEFCAFLSPRAESRRLAQRIWHERMHRRR
jgi:hypothetical protein